MNTASFHTRLLKCLVITSLVSFLAASPQSSVAVDPLPGKYRGKTGTTGRISFNVDSRGKRVTNLNVSIFALGQDDYGNFTTFQLIASNTDKKSFRVSKSGKFTGAGLDSKGIRYKVTGKLKGNRKFAGTAEMSWYHYSYYDFFLNQPVFELVSGRRPYTASL